MARLGYQRALLLLPPRAPHRQACPIKPGLRHPEPPGLQSHLPAAQIVFLISISFPALSTPMAFRIQVLSSPFSNTHTPRLDYHSDRKSVV